MVAQGSVAGTIATPRQLPASASLLTKLDRGREGGKWREKSEALGFLGFHGQGQGQNSGIDHSKGQEVLLVDRGLGMATNSFMYCGQFVLTLTK